MAFTQQTPIGTPDVNLITKTLAGLRPDSALQEYAALHKNNVYILSLAKAESDRRKEMRLAAQGNPGQQPTVADQSIAGMAPAPMMAQQQLPENQGIAQIPTPNIRTMADGGIAGYADDEEGMATGGMGGMFNFAQQSEPVVRMSGGGAVQKFAGQGEQLVRTTDGGKSWWLDIPSASRGKPAVASALANQKFASKQEAIAAYDAVAGGGEAPTPAYPTKYKTPEILPYGQSKATNVLGNAPPPPPPPADEKIKTNIDAPSIPGGPSLKVGNAMETGLGNLNTMTTDARNRYLRNANSTIPDSESTEEILARRSALMPKGKAYEETEASIKKEEAAQPEERKQAGLMALLQGFLGVAAGESPYAMTNIAKGLGLGLKDYGEALKEFKKSDKERQKQMAEIEQARRAEARGDVDKASTLYESAQDREQRRRAGIDQGLASLEAHGITSAGSLMGADIQGKYSLAGANVHAAATLGAAKMRSQDQKDLISGIRGGQLVENAMKDLKAQILKSNKYATPEQQDAEFERLWPDVLQKNPGLAKYAGIPGGGAAVDTTGFKVIR